MTVEIAPFDEDHDYWFELDDAFFFCWLWYDEGGIVGKHFDNNCDDVERHIVYED